MRDFHLVEEMYRGYILISGMTIFALDCIEKGKKLKIKSIDDCIDYYDELEDKVRNKIITVFGDEKQTEIFIRSVHGLIDFLKMAREHDGESIDISQAADDSLNIMKVMMR